MIKDLFVSFRDSIKDKTTNPFLGTYILVWLIRNWDLVYSVFNFDKEHDLEHKINYINNYYSEGNSFLWNVGANILWTFGVLISTYILLNISRAIVNLFEKQLKPWVYKYTDNKSIVLKIDYDLLKQQRDDLQVRLAAERESKAKLEVRMKTLEEQKKEENEGKKRQHFIFNKEEALKRMLSIKRKFIAKELIGDFQNLCIQINSGYSLDPAIPIISESIKYDLIVFVGGAKKVDGLANYELTGLGRLLYNDIINNDLIQKPPSKEGGANETK